MQSGYFIGGVGSNGGSSAGGEDVYLEDGEIVFAPVDPIYIDDNNNVFYDHEDKNSRMFMIGLDVFVERVI